MLIVRELTLGPLRFSELGRAAGGVPTDILTKRLRRLESDGIVSRSELAGPAPATLYELTEFGRGLERPLIELARWGMGLQTAQDVVGLGPSTLPNALRVILQPGPEAEFVLGLHTDRNYTLRACEGLVTACRGEAAEADLISPDPRSRSSPRSWSAPPGCRASRSRATRRCSTSCGRWSSCRKACARKRR